MLADLHATNDAGAVIVRCMKYSGAALVRPAIPRARVRVSLPLDLVLAAEAELLAVFREAVPGFNLTRDVFAALLFEHAWFDLTQDYYVGRGKDRKLVQGPNRKEACAMVRGYVVALFEGQEFDVKRAGLRRRRPRTK